MKRSIIFLMTMFMLSFAYLADAQETKGKTLSAAQSYFADASDVDLSTTSDSSFQYSFVLNKTKEQLYDYQVSLDSVNGTPDFEVQLYGRLFPGDSWAAIGSPVTWAGTSADTTITITEHTTAVFYRELQGRVTGQAGTGDATITQQYIKVWEK